jgi:CRP/FNR family transcriptional regulator
MEGEGLPAAKLATTLTQLARSACGVTWRRFDAGDFLFRQDEPARQLFFLLAGHVRFFLLSQDGRERTLRFLGPGDLAGDASFYLRAAYCANAEAFEGPVEAYGIRRTGYEALLCQHPELYEELLISLSRTALTLTRIIETQAFQDLRERVQMALIRAAGRYGRAGPDGVVIDMHLTHETIASMVGATRSRVSVCLSALQREGFYRVVDQRIVLSLWAAGLVLPP